MGSRHLHSPCVYGVDTVVPFVKPVKRDGFQKGTEGPTATFKGRLELVAAGRRLTPWLLSLGWKKPDVARVNKGHVPGPEKLALLAQKERVNLSWLLAGIGKPFIEQGGEGEVSEAPIPPYNVSQVHSLLIAELASLPEDSLRAIATIVGLLRR
jgi:hypothetical protein